MLTEWSVCRFSARCTAHFTRSCSVASGVDGDGNRALAVQEGCEKPFVMFSISNSKWSFDVDDIKYLVAFYSIRSNFFDLWWG